MTPGNFFFHAKEILKFAFESTTVHDIDSPFLFDLINEVVEKRSVDAELCAVWSLKKELSRSRLNFTRTDFGKKSLDREFNNSNVKLGAWIKNSSIDTYNGTLLYRLIHFFKPLSILEIGTAAGISTSCMALGNTNSRVLTLEGDPYLCRLSKENFHKLGLIHVELIEGQFTNTLPQALKNLNHVETAFIDGNHEGTELLRQINTTYPYLSNYKIIILDDIRWSKDMFDTWNSLIHDSRWNIALDFYRIGVLIQNTDLKHRVFRKILSKRCKFWGLGLVR